MPRYLISFDDGSMDHIPEEDWPTVGEASRAVVREIKHRGCLDLRRRGHASAGEHRLDRRVGR